LPRRQVVEIHTEAIALGALLKWAGIVGTGGEAKTLIASRRVLVNGQIEARRGRRLVHGDLVAIQGGPTLLITRAKHDPPPAALAPGIP
jgi:ribosome-associated protein